MKYIVMKITGLYCMMSFLIACAGKTAEAPVMIDKEQIKKEIQAKEDAFAALYNSREVKDIGYYADDATTFFQNTPAIVGKLAIVEFLTSDLAQYHVTLEN